MKIKQWFNNLIKLSPLKKSIISLVLAVSLIVVTTYAWFVIGKPNVGGIDSDVIEFPNGISGTFLAPDGGIIKPDEVRLDNAYPLVPFTFKLAVKKPVGSPSIKFVLRITNVTGTLKSGVVSQDVLKVYKITHTLNAIIPPSTTPPNYDKTFYEIVASPSNGYFTETLTFDSAGATIVDGKETKLYQFIFYLSDTAPDGHDINEFQGSNIKITSLSMEIIA